ncbi:MAG: hypothetical protein JJE49_09615 [Peptostreptococcaceae bacterium]|nr:hypothetical protein [Peptostreptococcaceae bacterium]
MKHSSVMDWTQGQWSTSLPTFGGTEPSDTEGIWSWDETRLIVGTCASDLQIISRIDARYDLVEDVAGEFCMGYCGRDTPKACEGCPIRDLIDSLDSILAKMPITK